MQRPHSSAFRGLSLGFSRHLELQVKPYTGVLGENGLFEDLKLHTDLNKYQVLIQNVLGLLHENTLYNVMVWLMP